MRAELIPALGSYPLAYLATVHLIGSWRRRNLVRRDTDVCIEAPPGSGNTFFVTGFEMINPGVTVAHHHHVRAQWLHAARYGIPTLLILRDPVECAISRVSAWGRLDLAGSVLRNWTLFFRGFDPDRHGLLAGFSSATEDPEGVVRQLNQRFGTSFQTGFPPDAEVFAEMDHRRRIRRGDGGTNPNRPGTDRVIDRCAAWEAITNLPSAERARRLYRALIDSAV